MLTFLRKIRRSLLDSGQTGRATSSLGRYFLYSFGEIALVVIGIMITLQINNWNEERKKVQTIKVYLSSIIKDLENDIMAYKEIEQLAIFIL